MSEAGSVEEYAVIFVWLAVSVLYTALLTLTALGVIFILRKRRSSILKNQKIQRTPFSELEFNVTTPTDTSKNRRVSFSRRTGVAEFVTNEATTTWKTFYEEHNKTAESSGNESGNASRQPLGHIGQRIFDQQFQDLEIDLVSTNIDPIRLNDVNFSQQIVALECVEEKNILFPQTNFELSSLTDHQTKLFGDDVTNPAMGEMSGRIQVNFSAVQPIADDNDDLDEIQKELDLVQNNGVCQGPFNARDMSQYIEVDLLMTHVPKNYESDMSITDTIHSPKVQDVSKSQIDKAGTTNKDWIANKENIAVIPYVAPSESKKNALNEESDNVLVFDGKRLTLQSNKDDLSSLDQTKNSSLRQRPQKKTIVLDVDDDLPNFVSNPDSLLEHKHIMTVSEDSNLSIMQPVQGVHALSDRKTIVYDYSDGNISVTQALSAKIVLPKREIRSQIIKPSLYENNTDPISIKTYLPANVVLTDMSEVKSDKRRTIVFDNESADISITQALPANIVLPDRSEEKSNKMRTLVFDNESADISMTQALPAKIVLSDGSEVKSDKRRTIVFDNENADISMTQALPANIVLPDRLEVKSDKRRTIVFDNENADISVTQTLPANIVLPDRSEVKRRTIVFDNKNADISVTQAVPTNIVLPDRSEVKSDKRRTIVFDNENADISMTQALPANIVLPDRLEIKSDKRRTIVFDNENADISVTQALPANIVLPDRLEIKSDKRRTIVFGNENADISVTQALPANIVLPNRSNVKSDKRRTIGFDNENADISVTQALPANIVLPNRSEVKSDKRRTIVFGNESADISMTQALPANIVLPNRSEVKSDKRRTIVFDNESSDISMTQALPANIVLPDRSEVKSDKRRTIVFDNENADISMTQALPANIVLPNRSEVKSDKRRTIVFDNKNADISMTQALPANIVLPDRSEVKSDKRRTIVFDNENADISMTQALPANIVLPDRSEVKSDKRRTIVFDNENADISMTQALLANKVLPDRSEVKSDKRRTIDFDNESADISMPEALPENIVLPDRSEVKSDKRRTIVFDNGSTDISVTQALPANIVLPDKPKVKSDKRRTIVFDNEDADISVTQVLPVNVVPFDKSRANLDKTESIALKTAAGSLSAAKTSPTDIILCSESITVNEKSKTWERNMESITVQKYVSSNITLSNKSDVILKDNKENISYIQEIPVNILTIDKMEKRKTVLYGNDLDNISVAQTLSSSVVFNNTDGIDDVSMTEITNQNIDTKEKSVTKTKVSNITGSLKQGLMNSGSIVFNDVRDLSKPIPADLNSIQKKINESKKVFDGEARRETFSDNLNVVVFQAVTDQSSKHTSKSIERGDSKSEDSVISNNLDKIVSNNLQTETFIDDDYNESIDEADENVIVKSVTNPSFQMAEKSKSKKSILNDLLDMSNASLVLEDNDVKRCSQIKNGSELSHSNSAKSDNLKSPASVISREVQSSQERVNCIEQSTSMQVVNSTQPPISVDTGKRSAYSSEYSTENDTHNSSEVMFRIVKDSDELIYNNTGKDLDIQIAKPNDGRKSLRFSNKIELRSPLPVEYKQSSGLVEDLKNKLEIIKTTTGNNDTSDRCEEKPISSEEEVNNTNYKDNLDVGVLDETKKLIDMLTKHIDEEEDEPVSPITVKGHIAIENKTEVKPKSIEIPIRRSFINRDELLRNLSMAKAVLSKSRYENSDFETLDSFRQEPEEHSSYTNNDVAKTLQFDEESFSDSSTTASPLKKTAIGDMSYITEPKKANVIPTFMENVPDRVKELMNDLIKPTADILPYDYDLNQTKKPISKCSTQIQANLNTSSQVELDGVEISSSLVAEISNTANKAITHALEAPTKSILISSFDKLSADSTEPMDVSSAHEEVTFRPRRQPIKRPTPEPVIVFDPLNPLNNVLLTSTNFSEVHKYDPVKSYENLITERSQSIQCSSTEQSMKKLSAESLTECDDEEKRKPTKQTDVDAGRAPAQYNVGNVEMRYQQSGDGNLKSADSETASIDQSVDVRLSELKDTEVNTVIAMRENKELLDTSSSLTLVDETTNREFHVNIQNKKDDSPTKATEGSPTRKRYGKAQKRNYSPFKRDRHGDNNKFDTDETPKRCVKQQKMSHGPNVKMFDVLRVTPQKICANDEGLFKSDNDLTAQKSTGKKAKSDSNMTVQQLLTEFNIHADINQEAMEKQILDALSRSSSVASALDIEENLKEIISFTSSKDQDKPRTVYSASSNEWSTESVGPWMPEVNIDTSKNMFLECDSSMNVVAKIDMLPIMGRDCEWEISTRDAWSFRLLRSRLRLRVRLEHRHSNALRTHVRADTPLTEIAVETVHYDKKNPIGATCVRLASEAMRYVCVRITDAHASIVPSLLRRCAAISRAALRWARAMHDARARLAYTLNDDGFVTLKVANTCLRSVWEVRFRIEMVLEGVLSTPWPRASDVRVIAVVAGGEACEAGAKHAVASVPPDWGHVPRSVWKVFKYLKHKRPDDEVLLGL